MIAQNAPAKIAVNPVTEYQAETTESAIPVVIISILSKLNVIDLLLSSILFQAFPDTYPYD